MPPATAGSESSGSVSTMTGRGKKNQPKWAVTAELWLVDDCLEDFTIFSPNSVSTLRGSYSNLKAGA